MQRYAVLSTPIGSAGLVASNRGLTHIVLLRGDTDRAAGRMQRHFPDAELCPDLLPGLQRQLTDYFAGKRVRFRVRPDLSSLTGFQQAVLAACAGIGYGETVTYGELAQRVGRPGAARAVGGVLARNPVPLVIPCHRVVAGNGRLGGFSAEQGTRLKQWLLELERQGLSSS